MERVTMMKVTFHQGYLPNVSFGMWGPVCLMLPSRKERTLTRRILLLFTAATA